MRKEATRRLNNIGFCWICDSHSHTHTHTKTKEPKWKQIRKRLLAHTQTRNDNVTHMRSPNYLPFNYIRLVLCIRCQNCALPSPANVRRKYFASLPHHVPSINFIYSSHCFYDILISRWRFIVPLSAHLSVQLALFIITCQKMVLIQIFARMHARTQCAGIGLYFSRSARLTAVLVR